MKRKQFITCCIFMMLPIQVIFSQERISPVIISPVIEKKLTSSQSYVGTIHPVKKSVVGSAVDGRVSVFPINDGEFVKKGATLAQLLTKTISLELEAAKAELSLKTEELNELENGSRPEDIKRANSLMLAAKTVNDYQQKKLKRIETLYTKQTINEDEVQKARSDAVKTKYVYEETLSAFNLMKEGPRPEKIAQASARVSFQAAMVEKLADQLKKHTIISPFDGYITKEHTEMGEWVNRGDPVADVIALDEVNLVVQVLDKQVTHLKTGITVEVEIPAIKNRRFHGVVVRIIPQADIRSRTFPVIIRLKNKITKDGPYLKSGMLIKAYLPTGLEKNSLMVPKDALVLGKGTPLLMVVDRKSKEDKNGIIRPVEVKLGTENGEWIQVTGKIKKNEQVVVRGNERVRPGQKVVIAKILPPPVQTGKSTDSKKVN